MAKYKLPSRLSLSDVATLDICKGGACANLPLQSLLDIAYDHGLDTKRGYGIEKGLHRTLQNKVIDGEYVIAEERMDLEWLKSGNASIEAITISGDDASLTAELNRMRRGGTRT